MSVVLSCLGACLWWLRISVCKIFVCLPVCFTLCLSICPSPSHPTARFLVCLLSLALYACPSSHLFFSMPPSLSSRPLPRPLSRLLPRLLSRLPVPNFPFTGVPCLSVSPAAFPSALPFAFSPTVLQYVCKISTVSRAVRTTTKMLEAKQISTQDQELRRHQQSSPTIRCS